MRQVAILTFLTLDGVMQGPMNPDEDTSGNFTQGGWAANYYAEVMPQVMREAMTIPYDLLLGRKTYDIFAAHFPSSNDNSPVTTMINNAKKFVVTTSSTRELAWHNSVPISGDIAAKISELKKQDGPLLQVHGSQQLIQALLAYDLIDEFRLWTFPVVLGNGKRLFDEGVVPHHLSLVKSAATSSGVVMGIYRR